MKAHHPFSLALLALLPLAAAAQDGDARLAAERAAHEAAATAPLLDRAAFLAEPQLHDVLLSPDGRHVAWLAGAGTEMTLHMRDLPEPGTAPRSNPADAASDATTESSVLFSSPTLRGIEWASATQLVLDLRAAVGVLTLGDPEGPAYLARLDLAKGDYLLGPARTSSGGVLLVRQPEPAVHVLEHVDLNAHSTELLRTDARIDTAFLSPDGTRVFTETVTANGRSIAEWQHGTMRTLLHCAVLTECRLLSHEAASDTLWLATSHDSDLLTLQALSLRDGSLQPLHRHPDGVVDLQAVTLTAARPVLVSYHDGTVQNHALDTAQTAALQQLERLLPGFNLDISASDDNRTWLVAAQSSIAPEADYHVYDTTTRHLRPLLQAAGSAGLPVAALSRKIPLQYRARDGMTIHGYVTLPKGIALAKAPLIALPHGGPRGRVLSDYAAFTQFLVNRGYIVFEPNFRASTGYGLAYAAAAQREFGNSAVQHDIIDGVHYLLAHGIGDADRLGIVGASFGGFSVLAGLAFTPDLFKVGVAAVPPASMSLGYYLSRPGVQERNPALKAELRQLIVDIDDPADMQRLHALSPEAHLGNIRAPLLIAAGADDDRVDIAHVKRYALELHGLGKTISVLIDEDEGHGLSSPLAREAWYYLTERMLAQTLGGRMQPLDDAVLTSYLQRKLLLNNYAALTLDDQSLPNP